MRILLDTEEGRKSSKEKNANGDTPLHLASFNGHPLVVKILLEAEQGKAAASKEKNSKGRTPMHLAAQSGHSSVVKMIMDTEGGRSVEKSFPLFLLTNQWTRTNRAHIKDKDRAGDTPVHEAALNGHIAVAKLLLDSEEGRETLGEKSNLGRTPMHCAAVNGQANVFR